MRCACRKREYIRRRRATADILEILRDLLQRNCGRKGEL